MEVWILLAAAGSGFLARHWQKNAHKVNDPPPTGGASEEDKERGGGTPSEGNNPNRPTSEDPLARRQRYRQFLSSNRKQSSGKEFGNPCPYIRTVSKHPPPRTPRNSTDQPWTLGKLADSNASEKTGRRNGAFELDIATEESGSSQIPSDSLLCLDEGGGEDKRPPPTPLDYECGSWNPRERSSFSYKRSNNANKGPTEESEKLETGIRGKRLKNGVDEKEKDTNQSKHPSSFSSQRPNNANKGHTEENERFETGIDGKRYKDEREKGGDNREEAILVGNLTSIFWDQSQIFFSEGLFDYSSEQRVGGTRSRSGSSSRRAKTPKSRSGKRGEGSCPWNRKKSLPALAKPLSSLESCLSAQLFLDTEKREGKRRTQGYPLYQTSASNGEKQALKVTCENNEVSLTDVRQEAGVSGNRTTTLGHLQHDIPLGLPSLPTPPQSHSLEVNVASTSVSANTTEARFQSTRSTDSDKGIWFNFGVGVGMMFAISSNMNEVDILAESLGEMEALLKDLERQFEASESETYGDVKRGDGQSHNSSVSKVMSLSQSLRRITCSLTKIKYPKCTDSGDMPKLEAELEAELERMELNFHPGNISKANRFCEIQSHAESGRLHGELVVEGIPLKTEFDSESSHSSEEEHHQMSNYAVSPHDLERRLYQVLESRLEDRIAELETELDNTATKLQMKEEQLESLQGIKNQSLRNIYSPAYSSSKDTCEGSVKESVEQGFLFKTPNCDLSISSESSSQSSRHDVESRAIRLDIPTVVGARNSSKKAPLFVALAGEALDAYNEACDEFLKVLSGSEDKLDKNSGETLNLGKDTGFAVRDYSGQLEDCWGDTDLLLAHTDQELPARCVRTRADSFQKNRDTSNSGSVGSLSRTESEQMLKARELFEDIAYATTSGSTPCSIKLIDKSTHSLVWNKESSSNQGGVSTPVLSSGVEIIPWNTKNHLPSRNQGGSSSTMTSVRSKYFESGDADFDHIVDEAEDVSDSDEQMGKLLIKRIVEKTRKGSPIVQAAQTVLASLERADRPSHWN